MVAEMRNIFYEVTDEKVENLGIWICFGFLFSLLLCGLAAGVLYFEGRPFIEVFELKSSVSVRISGLISAGFFVFMAWVPIWRILQYYLGYRNVIIIKGPYWVACALIPVFIGLLAYGILLTQMKLSGYIFCDNPRPRTTFEILTGPQGWHRRENCIFDEGD
jgi:hypothetical protein